MDRGDTFVICDPWEDPEAPLDKHLWIILSDPSIDPEHVLIVNTTSWEAFKDQACILNNSDHPFITYRTCVNYPKSKAIPIGTLNALLAKKLIAQREPMRDKVLDRIYAGAEESTKMPMGMAQILIDQGLIC